MAAASLTMNGKIVSMRNFHPPKQASVTHWYRAATAQIDQAPDWRTVDMGAALIDEGSIIFHGDDWSLYISRKKNLR